MTYDLYLGDRTYSSWSLRGWLLFEKFGIPANLHMVGLYSGKMAEDLADLAPARLVPVIRTPEGDALQDTLAIAETLAERHPEAGMWPADPSARILARWLCAEMHSGFMALRSACPMNLGKAYAGFEPGDDVLADLARIERLWTLAMERFGGDGPWLFGAYSIADAFYAPVAARIAGYGLPVGEKSAGYVARHLADDAFCRWRALGLTERHDPEPYAMDLPTTDWPGPVAVTAPSGGLPENAA